MVGIAYAYFVAALEGVESNTTITVEAGYMNIVYDGGPNINASEFGPSDIPFAIKNFTVTGTSTIDSDNLGYKVSLIIDENTFTTNAISYTLDSINTGNSGRTIPEVTESQPLGTANVVLGSGYFLGIIDNLTHNYELKLYFYDTNEDQTFDMEKTFKAHISIEKYNPCATGECLRAKILAQGGGTAAIKAKFIPDFSVINGTSGLYAADDEYGTSYYYRGKKTELNNNLIWGGFQWKIVRINGDGSIRLIYNGTEAQFNTNGVVNDIGANTQISGTHAWNKTNYNDAKYVGYMYGGANGVASTVRDGTTSDAATYNETSTNIKTVLDTWYQTNIFGKSFESQIADNLFCNDRNIQSGPGYGKTGVTSYAPNYRITPTLKCTQKNDRFTSSDKSIGNGDLTYPVGLITVDETSMAGLTHEENNSTNYLYTNQNYKSFSPLSMESGVAFLFYVSSSGYTNPIYANISSGVRPAVSIISEAKVTGSGTSTDPYIVLP